MSTRIILKDRVYIPERKVDPEALERVLIRAVYNEDACSHCDFMQDRHSDSCDNCASYKGTYKLYNEVEIDNKNYYGVSIGYLDKLGKLLNDSDIKIRRDERVEKKFKHAYELTGSLWDYQEVAVNEMIKFDNGFLESKPRTGKTVMGTALIIKLGVKTLIMGAQVDWLYGFYDTICGNADEGLVPFTNIPDVEKFEGKRLAGLCKSYEDFKAYDICLATYQTFLSAGGKKLLERVKRMFGCIMVDEAHDTAADQFCKTLNSFESRYRYGLSGTVDRKDGKIFIAHAVLGPVRHRTDVEVLKPEVNFIETGHNSNRNFTVVTYAHKELENNKSRTQLIIDTAIKHLHEGRSILIPVVHTEFLNTLVNGINKKWGSTIAVGFHGKLKKTKTYNERKELVKKAREGKIRVVVGIRKIVQVGLNVPRWDTIYMVSPISNPPKMQQETSRICTPMAGKKTPKVVMFLDNQSFSRGCLRTCLYKNGFYAMKFKIPASEAKKVAKYTGRAKFVSSKDSSQPDSEGKLYL